MSLLMKIRTALFMPCDTIINITTLIQVADKLKTSPCYSFIKSKGDVFMKKKYKIAILFVCVLFLFGCRKKENINTVTTENKIENQGMENGNSAEVEENMSEEAASEESKPEEDTSEDSISEDSPLEDDMSEESISGESTSEESTFEESTSEENAIEEDTSKDTIGDALLVPSSGLYTDMVVKKLDYIPLESDDKVVYLTFDDGPCESTPELLAVLRELNVKATFFVTAQFGTDEKVLEWMKMIKEDGHELAVHSYSHKYNEIYNSVEEFLADYKKMDDMIIEATGERSHIYRFPGGSNAGYNKSIRTELIEDLNSRGIVYHDWNAYDGDCDGFSKDQMIQKAVKESGYKNKSILLMHNIPKKGDVIKALPEIVGQLKNKGYRFDVLDGTVEPIQFIQ